MLGNFCDKSLGKAPRRQIPATNMLCLLKYKNRKSRHIRLEGQLHAGVGVIAGGEKSKQSV
jgi:hypothetical protein